jgi:hypothetical protein
MNIKLYYNTSDNRYINKTLSLELSINGNLKNETSLLSPIITIKSDAVLRYNYAYIPEFKRYYYITGIENVRNEVWRLYLQVDPLMSFKADILSLKVVVNKQSDSSNGDEYIDDGSLVTDNQIFKNVYNFPNGFNDNGEYILITAG